MMINRGLLIPIIAIELLFLILIGITGLSPATAQDKNDAAILRRELEELKNEHSARIEKSEERLRELEGEAAVIGSGEEEARSIAVEALKKSEEARALAEKSGDTHHKVVFPPPETYPSYLTRGFEFHGYLRSGYGINGQGGRQVYFKGPGPSTGWGMRPRPTENWPWSITLSRNPTILSGKFRSGLRSGPPRIRTMTRPTLTVISNWVCARPSLKPATLTGLPV